MSTDTTAASSATAPAGSTPQTVPLQQWIGGTWQDGTGQVLESTSPAAPDVVVAAGPQASPEQVDAALAAARDAAADWAATPLAERGAVLARAAVVLEENAEDWGAELSREEGKTRAEGVGEVKRAAQILRYFSAAGDRSNGTVYPSPRAGETILVRRRPLGLVGIITPFNFPIAIPAWKIAPALVYGNTVVWKPASLVPLLALRLAQALEEGGLPAGVLNLVIGPGALGSRIVEFEGLDGLSFTGSTRIGRQLAAECAQRGVPFQGEMGGKNAAVVLADADLDVAVDQVLAGAFRSTGQKCTATSRVVVEEPVVEEFLERLRARLADFPVGDPLAEGVQMGPLVSVGAARDVAEGVRRAVEAGAQPVIGAAPEGGHPAGPAFLDPLVLRLGEGAVSVGDAVLDNPAWTEEFFGPVLTLVVAADRRSALELAADSPFGLSGAVFTTNLANALEAVEHLDVGVLHVNSESAGADPHVPFGGAGKSGLGPKEQGEAAQEFYTHTTTVYLRG